MGFENLEVREGVVMAGEATPNSLASIEKKERAQTARNDEKRNPLKSKTQDKDKGRYVVWASFTFSALGLGETVREDRGVVGVLGESRELAIYATPTPTRNVTLLRLTHSPPLRLYNV